MGDTQQLLDSLNNLEVVVDEWTESGQPTIVFGGGVIQIPNLAIEIALDQVFSLTSQPDWDDSVKHTVLAVDRLEAAFSEWEIKLDLYADKTTPNGTFWNEYSDALAKREPWVNIELEPIEELAKMDGMRYEQIARMYGWFTNGSPDVAKVTQALASKGKYEKPKAPRDIDHDVEIAEMWGNRPNRRRIQSGPVGPTVEPPCPESLEQLIRHGREPGGETISIDQILRMDGNLTRNEVIAKADELGLAMKDATNLSSYAPPKAAERARDADKAMQAEYDAKQAEATDNAQRASESMPAGVKLDEINPPALEQPEETDADAQSRTLALRIMGLSDDGMKPGQIADTLKDQFPGLTHQKVGKMLKAAHEAEAELETA